MEGGFGGRVALITGGNSGIGLAAALEFARCGARVVLAARRKQQGADAIERIGAAGGEAAFVATDVTDSYSVRGMVDFCLATFGRLDFAYNNAGTVGDIHTEIADAGEEAFDRVIATNLRGTWLSMKYEVPAILATGGGAIVNCGSVSGLQGSIRASAYSASKHAVLGMTRAVALDYAEQGIRVNAICPALTMTDIVERDYAKAPGKLASNLASIPMGRAAQPGEVARAVTWLCGADGSFITGTAIPVDGGRTL